nr:hypothetical protein [Tanacetum cinerariifolium]
MDEGTKILATVDGKPRTISESSIRRNLKLKDEAGISSLPDAELFENLTLMGYNISPNQKFSFQKGQFSHQWKYLIHIIMQCLSPKSNGFNEFSSDIATTLVCLATNRVYNFSKMTFDGMVQNVKNKVSKFLMYPRFLSKCLKMGQFGQITHTHMYDVPFHTRKVFTILRVNSPSFLGRIVPLFSTMLVTMVEGSGTPTEPYHTPTPEATPSPQHELSSSSLPPAITETIHTIIPTDNPPLRQYTRRARIAQSSALPTVADKPASLFGDDSQGEACPTLKARIKILEDKDGGDKGPSGEDATIKGRSLKTGEEACIERKVPTVSIPPAGEISTSSGMVPTASPIFTTATKIELINELVKYQDHHASILKYQAQQSKPLSKKQQREFYTSVLRSHVGWKSKHFKAMSQKEIREKFVPVWKQIKDFFPMGSKEERERFKRKGLKLEQESAKKVKTSEEVSEEDFKDMMQLVPVEEVYVEALQHFDREDLNLLWALVKETLSIRLATSDKEKELWVELKRLYEPDVEDQLRSTRLQIVQDKELIEGILSSDEFPLPEFIPTAMKKSSLCCDKEMPLLRRLHC